MPTVTRDNERSWAIELISEINTLCSNNDWKIKKAGGEKTVSLNRTSMFPDVILFGDDNRSFVLQGWELKMPDVLIENEEFIKDAQRKALALNLNSCLIWNFTYAVLYIKKQDNTFEKVKTWNNTSHIRTREDVRTYASDWKALLEEVLIFINSYLLSGQICSSSIGNFVSDSVFSELIRRNKSIVSEHIRHVSATNSDLGAKVLIWWLGVKEEYVKDESNEFDAFAKTIILNWAIRILFAHIIKTRQNSALVIDAFDENVTPHALNSIFDGITNRCDFYNIFASIPGDEFMPDEAWRDLADFSCFLKENSIRSFDQTVFQSILEETISHSRRELNGQYTTPSTLAEILLKLTVTDWSGDILDCCCGTGTIPQKAIAIKKTMFNPTESAKHVWASDKYSYPLQVANISMASPATMHVANLVFQHNALSLIPGTDIYITNPNNGVREQIQIPYFDAVVSNLPFVHFETIPEDDKALINCDHDLNIDGRSDLYAYIALHIEKLLKINGHAGLITSNSWLAANGGAFFNLLKRKYNILQIHISGNGRWFKNADIVTTLLILEKRNGNQIKPTSFVVWRKSLEDLSQSEEDKNRLTSGCVLSRNVFPEVYQLSSYSQDIIDSIKALNVSYNVFFHEVNWLLEIRDKLVPINTIFNVFRGSRRGWDNMFYPARGTHRIEEEFIQPVLKNARNVNYLDVAANNDAFCCDQSIQELQDSGKLGALEWIRLFENQVNGVGRPLPQVLAKANAYWYQLERNEIAELFTMMNPDKRFFYGRLTEPSFINQRLIGLTRVNANDDLNLLHALLNSVVSYFYIEASGFGRGLGVLDINKDNIERCFMLNPTLINEASKREILARFDELKETPITDISAELRKEERIAFEHAVFRAFGIENYLESVINSLKSMIKTRDAVKNR